MGQEVPNVGETGVASIRIGGMKLDTLPIAEAAIAKQQWSEKQAEEIRNKIEDILGKYPQHTVEYLKARITECQENIVRIRKLKSEQETMINDYAGHIGMCNHRDRELAKLDPERPEDAAQIKKLKIQYPPYNVQAMKQQIDQCKEAILRCDVVVDAENKSIAELNGTLALCKQRDSELKQFGVKVG